MRLQRLLGMLCVLANVDKITVQELADRFEVSRRTIFRDLDALNNAGIPIVSYPGLGGGVSIVEGYTVGKRVLSTDDTEKLFTALKGLKSIDSDPAVFDRSRYVINLSSWFSDSTTQEKVLALLHAIEDQYCITMEYISRSGRSTRVVEPHKLVFKQSHWYIYGYCRQRGGFRLFRLSRIAAFHELEEHFTIRPIGRLEFDNRYGAGDFCACRRDGYREVVLECSRGREYELSGRIDASFFEADSGSLPETSRIRFYTADLHVAADFIMQIADKVRVVSPPELRAVIGQRIAAINSFYNG